MNAIVDELRRANERIDAARVKAFEQEQRVNEARGTLERSGRGASSPQGKALAVEAAKLAELHESITGLIEHRQALLQAVAQSDRCRPPRPAASFNGLVYDESGRAHHVQTFGTSDGARVAQ